MASRRISIAAVCLLSAAVGCTEQNPVYCDEATPCTDPTRPYCDLSIKTCGEAPDANADFDARPPAPPDANTADAAPATCESIGAECGLVLDGMGGTLDCGTCALPFESCGDVAANQCDCPPGEWHVETVDNAGAVGRGNAIGVDPTGTVHIVYFDSTNDDLKYARRTAGSADWEIEIAASEETQGQFPSMTVDVDGGVHAAHWAVAGGGGGVAYSHRSPTGDWTTEYANADILAGVNSSVAVDDFGVVHICYYYSGARDLHYAFRTPGLGWTVETLDTAGDDGLSCSIALTSEGIVHVTYSHADNDDLMHAQRTPGDGWTTGIAVSAGQVGGSTSLAIDDAGTLHVSHLDLTARDLKYSYKTPGSAWTTETADGTADRVSGYNTSIAVAESGTIHIGYWELSTNKLKHATRTPMGVWALETVDTIGNTDAFLSLDLDASGVLHMSYHDASTTALKYARRCPDAAD